MDRHVAAGAAHPAPMVTLVAAAPERSRPPRKPDRHRAALGARDAAGRPDRRRLSDDHEPRHRSPTCLSLRHRRRPTGSSSTRRPSTDGVMKMRPATSGVTVPAGGTVELKPDGGYHLMLGGLKAPLRSGTMLPVTLRFAKAGSIEVVFAVEPIGARGPSTGAAPGHNHH